MRDYAKVSSQFWIGECGRKLKKLGGEARLTACYLITSPHSNMIGVYYLPVSFIAHETGLSPEEALKGLRSLQDIQFCSYDDMTEYVWIHDTAFDQIGFQLMPSDNRVKAVREAYADLPELPFLGDFYDKYEQAFCLDQRRENRCSEEGPCKALSSQKQKQKQEQKQKKNIMSSNEIIFLSNEKNDFENPGHL